METYFSNLNRQGAIRRLIADLRILLQDLGAVLCAKRHMTGYERIAEVEPSDGLYSCLEGNFLTDKTVEHLLRHPLTSVGIAFAVGFLLGAGLVRRNKKDRGAPDAS